MSLARCHECDGRIGNKVSNSRRNDEFILRGLIEGPSGTVCGYLGPVIAVSWSGEVQRPLRSLEGEPA